MRILSIDGGGIRGILPGQILVALEEKLQKKSGNTEAKIADYFDLIAGTSTGGILACLYLCQSLGSRPLRLLIYTWIAETRYLMSRCGNGCRLGVGYGMRNTLKMNLKTYSESILEISN